jgi:hypothetical protein
MQCKIAEPIVELIALISPWNSQQLRDASRVDVIVKCFAIRILRQLLSVRETIESKAHALFAFFTFLVVEKSLSLPV